VLAVTRNSETDVFGKRRRKSCSAKVRGDSQMRTSVWNHRMPLILSFQNVNTVFHNFYQM
jgi:hypothetical protein